MPLNNPLTQVAQAFTDAAGQTLALLRTKFGSSQSVGVTTTPGAAVQVHANDFNTPVRIWAVGCPIIYIFGASGVVAPSATADGYIGQDRFIETYMGPAENFIRFAAASGTGTIKVEVLR